MTRFEQLLRRRGIPYHKSVSDAGEFTLCCPFCPGRGHSPDKRFRLGVNAFSSKGQCFNCGWKSRHAVEIFAKAVRLGEVRAEQSEAPVEKKSPERVELPEDFTRLAFANRSNDPRDGWPFDEARQYLRGRGITRWQMMVHRMGVSLSGRQSFRVIFPVYNYGTRLIGYVGRDFTGKQKPPYLNSVGTRVVYNMWRKEKENLWPVVCEGIFDCLAIERSTDLIGRFSLPDCDKRIRLRAVATLGDKISETQLEQLSQFQGLIIWPDNDKVGVNSFSKLADSMQQAGKSVYLIRPPKNGKDAGDLSDKQVMDQLLDMRRWNWIQESRLRASVAMR